MRNCLGTTRRVLSDLRVTFGRVPAENLAHQLPKPPGHPVERSPPVQSWSGARNQMTTASRNESNSTAKRKDLLNMSKRKDSNGTGKLGQTKLDSIRTPGYYPDPELHGLKLKVQHTKSEGTTKSWVLRATIDGQDTHLGLGSYPAVSREEARRLGWAARDEIAAKRDPRRRNDPTVQQMGDKIVAERSSSNAIWASDGTRKRWQHNLHTHIYPKIGRLRVKAVTPAHIMECLVPPMKEHPETGRQVQSHLRVIFGRVVAENLRGDDPTEAVAAALGPIHPRRRNRPMPALAYQQVAEALQRVRESDAHWATKGVCQMMVYTGTRQSETRGARWDEINRDEALLCLPGRRTKSGLPLVVPLSGPVLAVLDDAWERTGGVGLVFPSATGRPISPRHARQTAEKPRFASRSTRSSQQLQDLHERARHPRQGRRASPRAHPPLRPGRHRPARTTPPSHRTVGTIPHRQQRP